MTPRLTPHLRAGLLVVALWLIGPAARAQQADTAPADAQPAAIVGTVYDSIGAHPLAGAIVQLLQPEHPASSYAARSDSTGEYRIPHVAPGRYIIGFQDPLLDSLGIAPPVRAVVVGGAPTVTVALATPSGTTLRASLCSLRGPTDSTGAILGRVGDADSGRPLAGATVVAVWREIVIDSRGLHQDRREVPARTNDAGWYAICAIPPGDLMARAELGTRASGFVPVTVPPRGLARLNLTVAPDSAAVTVADTTHAGLEPIRRGTARLTGIVRDDHGRPAADATVVVLGTRSSAVTDEDGRFGIGGLPAGSQAVEVRKLGFMAVRAIVNLASDRVATTSLAFDTRVAALQPVTVYGKAGHGRISEFLRRRRMGFGYFLTRQDIEKRHPFDVADLFRMVPGLWVVPTGGFGYSITNNAGIGRCAPAIYLDGIRMQGEDARDIASYVSPEEVAGIEVYTHAGEVPPQYEGNGCGVILIWTGTRAP